MNREEILNMPAGRELDALVAEKVMGFIKLPFPGLPKYQKPTKDGVVPLYYVPNFSTDISAAWEVVEKMCDGDKNKFMIYRFGFGPKKPKIRWRVSWGQGWENLLSYCDAESAPLAICRAALLTVCE